MDVRKGSDVVNHSGNSAAALNDERMAQISHKVKAEHHALVGDYMKSFWDAVANRTPSVKARDYSSLDGPLRDDPEVGKLVVDQIRVLAEQIQRGTEETGPIYNGDISGLGAAIGRSQIRAYNRELVDLWFSLFPVGATIPAIVVPVINFRTDLIVGGLDDGIGGTFDRNNAADIIRIVGDKRLAVPPAAMIEALGRNQVLEALPTLRSLRMGGRYIFSIVPALGALEDNLEAADQFDLDATKENDPDKRRDLIAAAARIRERLG